MQPARCHPRLLPTITLLALDADHCSSSSEHASSGLIDQHCTDPILVAVAAGFLLIAAIWKAIAEGYQS